MREGMQEKAFSGVLSAAKALKAGLPVVVFDSSSREGECDIMLHAGFATPKSISLLRNKAGGLVCLATNQRSAKRLGLPFLSEIYASQGMGRLVYGRTKYGDRPAFSISINHQKTFTGITDNDRALTAREFSRLVGNGCHKSDFSSDFKAPGHVQLLISSGLKERQGHTELGLELCRLASLPPAILMCEMLSTGKAMGKGQALEFARKNDLVFIEGKEILEAVR